MRQATREDKYLSETPRWVAVGCTTVVAVPMIWTIVAFIQNF